MQTRKCFSILFLLLVGINLTYGQAPSAHSDKGEKVNFTKPDEVRDFPLGHVDLVKIGGAMIGKAVFKPGWKWSTSVKPIANTESCLAPHFQYHVSGTLRVKMDDGTLIDCKPGDVSYLPMGHDAWVVGNTPVVVIDFQGMIDYAKTSMNK